MQRRATTRAAVFGRRPPEQVFAYDVRAITIERPRELVLESTDLGGTYRNTFQDSEQGEGSVVTREPDLPRPDGVPGLAAPLFERLLQGRDLAKGLSRLASHLHSQGER